MYGEDWTVMRGFISKHKLGRNRIPNKGQERKLGEKDRAESVK